MNFVIYLLSLSLSLPLPSSIITLGLLININLTNAVLSAFPFVKRHFHFKNHFQKRWPKCLNFERLNKGNVVVVQQQLRNLRNRSNNIQRHFFIVDRYTLLCVSGEIRDLLHQVFLGKPQTWECHVTTVCGLRFAVHLWTARTASSCKWLARRFVASKPCTASRFDKGTK